MESSFAQTYPTITNPATENGQYSRANITAQWNAVSGATYKLYMRDTTVNMLVLNGVNVSGTSYAIAKKYFYEGHNYRIAVSATVGTTTTWGERNLKIKLSNSRLSILSRGGFMNAFCWTPTSTLRGWKNRITYTSGIRYQGIPYSQTAYQCSISAVPWTFGYYFDTKMSAPDFYDNYTSNNIIMPKYGNDCSGYVSVCWNIVRHNTTDISSHPRVGKTTETKLKQFARLSPGDALVDAGNHTFIINSISAINDSNGNVIDLRFICYEQTLYNCQQTTRLESGYTGYIGVTKDSNFAQDYTWNWQ